MWDSEDDDEETAAYALDLEGAANRKREQLRIAREDALTVQSKKDTDVLGSHDLLLRDVVCSAATHDYSRRYDISPMDLLRRSCVEPILEVLR